MAQINENDKIRIGDTITCTDEMDAATYIAALNCCGYGWEKTKDIRTEKIILTIISEPKETKDGRENDR